MNSKLNQTKNITPQDDDFDDLPPLVILEIPKAQKQQLSLSIEKSLLTPMPVPFISEQSHISAQQSIQTENTLRPDSPLQRMADRFGETKEEPQNLQSVVIEAQRMTKIEQKDEKKRLSPLRRNQTMISESVDKLQIDSEKFAEGFLKIAKIDLSIFETNAKYNQNDKMSEPILQDKLMTQAKIFQLKHEQHLLTNKNDLRFKNLEVQVELLEEKILHLDQILNLLKDKVSLKQQISNFKRVLDQLAKQFIRIQQEFKDQLSKLTSFILNLPSEKEKYLEIKIQNLNQQLEEERKQKDLLESSFGKNIFSVQQLMSDATEAKKQLLDQVKLLKKKNEKLDEQIAKSQQDQNLQLQLNRQQVLSSEQDQLFNSDLSQSSLMKYTNITHKSQRKIFEGSSIQNSQLKLTKVEIQE